MNPAGHPQRIAKLTALGAVLERISALAPVPPGQFAPHDAAGGTLAEHAVASRAVPEAAIALRDGWAVRAGLLSGAGSYSPVPLSPLPPRIDAGALMPANTDAVAPLDAVRMTGSFAEAVAEIAPGEGVLLAGASADAGAVLRQQGARFRVRDAAIAAYSGIDHVAIRKPRIALAWSKGGDGPALAWLRRAIECAGGEIEPADGLRNAFEAGADAVVALGGTGTGSADRAVEALAHSGEVLAHGIAISPGETTAFGLVNSKPVLLLPGRFDAAFGAWLLLGGALVAQLAGAGIQEPVASLTLTRKISSSLGLTEAVLVRREGDSVTPFAAGYFPLEALARADGWVRVPPESEGFPSGGAVGVLPLPDLL